MAKRSLIIEKDVDLKTKFDAFGFQEDAFNTLKDLEYAGVFHEQGLGKTKIAIDLLLYWIGKKSVDTVLIITKKGLVNNWEREFANHTHIRPRILTQDKRKNFFIFNSPTRVIISHFEILLSESKRLSLFAKGRKVGIILDESHKIKNPGTKLTQSAIKLADLFVKRLILTGTPIANRPYDIWAQIKFLDGGTAFGEDYESFKNKTDIVPQLNSDAGKRRSFELSINSIFPKISSFCVRETKNSGIIDLPNKVVRNIDCEFEANQEQIYNSIRNDLKITVVKEGIPRLDESDAVIKRILRLVQAASNPLIFDESYQLTPGKYDNLIEIIDECLAAGQKAIVWTHFTKVADWLTKKLKHLGARKIHGKLAYSIRQNAVDDFIENPSCKILVATPGAAKEGLTLTVANHVIFYDRGFSLDDYLQAQDRIHRISQQETCYVYNLIMKDSIDHWIDLLLKAKHCAAKLAQGDLEIDEYQEEVDYSFSDILYSALNLQPNKEGFDGMDK